MKRTMKSAAMGLFALATVSTAYPVMANANNNKPAAELTLVGRANNQPQYQLNLNNTNAEEVIVIIRDNFGNVLHHEVLKGANISRTFQMNVDDLEGADLRLEVISRTSKDKVAFEILDNATVVLRKS